MYGALLLARQFQGPRCRYYVGTADSVPLLMTSRFPPREESLDGHRRSENMTGNGQRRRWPRRQRRRLGVAQLDAIFILFLLLLLLIPDYRCGQRELIPRRRPQRLEETQLGVSLFLLLLLQDYYCGQRRRRPRWRPQWQKHRLGVVRLGVILIVFCILLMLLLQDYN